MDDQTGHDVAGNRFPPTRYSAVIAAAGQDPLLRERAIDTLMTIYWKPVYKYVRIKWRATPENAQDLVQGFFTHALEREFFGRYDPARASFRTWLRTCLDGYVSNERRAASRRKRGGDVRMVSLDYEGVERELKGAPAADTNMDAYFHREWVRSLFGAALAALREQCERGGKQAHLAVFERYDLQEHAPGARPTYKELALQLGVPETQVTNYLAWTRREFRALVLQTLREITATEEEYQAEARSLLGVPYP